MRAGRKLDWCRSTPDLNLRFVIKRIVHTIRAGAKNSCPVSLLNPSGRRPQAGSIHLLGAPYEGGELCVEARRILEERGVADALVDRELGARDHLGGVFGGDQVRVLVFRAV